jgi:hypothetical protein
VLAWLRPSAPALSTSKRATSCLSHTTCYLLCTKLLRPLAGHTAILHSARLFFSLPGGLAVRRVAERYHSSKHWVLGTIPQMSDFCRYLGVACGQRTLDKRSCIRAKKWTEATPTPQTGGSSCYYRSAGMRNRKDRRVVPAVVNVRGLPYVIRDSMPPTGKESDEQTRANRKDSSCWG